MSQDTLASNSIQLASWLHETVDNAVRTGSVQKTKTQRFREKIVRFEYKEGNVSYQSSQVQEEIELWGSNTIANFTDEASKTPFFTNLVKILSAKRSVNEAQTTYWLRNFSMLLITEILNGSNKDRILELAYSYISEVEGNPIEFSQEIWLQGLWMKDDDVDLKDQGIELRKPVAKDLERNLVRRGFGMWPHGNPSAIMTITIKTKDPSEIFPRLEAKLSADYPLTVRTISDSEVA
jgi:hypothetical protein